MDTIGSFPAGCKALARRKPAPYFSATELARLLQVSVATVHRVIAALRRQGERIVPVRDNGRWHYELRTVRSEEELQNDPLLKMAGFIKEWKAMPEKTEDQIVYGIR